jgi:prepilin-type N-terminal cleavage/methylation domain-containing protein
MVRTNVQQGFTLLELLIVMALIAILVGIVFAALNPGRQFANGRNTTRLAHLNTIMNAVSSNMAENNGTFTCAAGALPAAATDMANGAGNYDIAPCIVTEYISAMPYDPSGSGAHWTTELDYDSGYDISQDADGRVTLAAPSAEIGATISMTR